MFIRQTRTSNKATGEGYVTYRLVCSERVAGKVRQIRKAKRGRSKEKRSDCPLVTLGLVLDGSGFVRRSQTFAGNVSEPGTLVSLLTGLGAPAGALVVMDAGMATDANVAWLVAHGYRYLVVRRGGMRQFDETRSVTIETAGEELLHLHKELSPDGQGLCLYCHSPTRQFKEEAMLAQSCGRFEAGLQRRWTAQAPQRKESRPAAGTSWPTQAEEPWCQPTLPSPSRHRGYRLQRRVTSTFSQRDGRSLHVRKATVAEPDLLAIYRALGISAAPGGTRKADLLNLQLRLCSATRYFFWSQVIGQPRSVVAFQHFLSAHRWGLAITHLAHADRPRVGGLRFAAPGCPEPLD
jgi:hypothetical protein